MEPRIITNEESIQPQIEPPSACPRYGRIMAGICFACFVGVLFVFASGSLDWTLQELLDDKINRQPGTGNVPVQTISPQKIRTYFSKNYATSRARFIESAESAGAKLSRIVLSERGPQNEELTIDIAWIGNLKPRRAILHVSGVHGVEGFAGSAIQLKILENHPKPPQDGALIFVHILNPYGMAWLRRYNETNVDLNRNFRSTESSWADPVGLYAEIDDFINPSSKKLFDGFFLHALIKIVQHGYPDLRKAIPKGQGTFPKGLFYCGQHLEQGPDLYSSWIVDSFSSIRHLLVIDVHTGLGKRGQESLFHKITGTDSTLMSEHLGRLVSRDYESSGAASYAIRGAHSEIFRQLPTTHTVDFITQEFGTYTNLYVLQALRDENRYHHYEEIHIEHPAKQRLREAFNPSLLLWRASVIQDGESLFSRASEVIFHLKRSG